MHHRTRRSRLAPPSYVQARFVRGVPGSRVAIHTQTWHPFAHVQPKSSVTVRRLAELVIILQTKSVAAAPCTLLRSLRWNFQVPPECP